MTPALIRFWTLDRLLLASLLALVLVLASIFVLVFQSSEQAILRIAEQEHASAANEIAARIQAELDNVEHVVESILRGRDRHVGVERSD